MTLLRELGRRSLRTTLTVLGITIGIWALVVFSSMANRIDSKPRRSSDASDDETVATRLWRVSAEFVGLSGGPGTTA